MVSIAGLKSLISITLSEFEQTRFANAKIFDRFHRLSCKHFLIGCQSNGWDSELCRKKCGIRVGYDEHIEKHCTEKKSSSYKLAICIFTESYGLPFVWIFIEGRYRTG